MKIDVKVPGMGESINEVTIGTIMVASGSQAQADQPIVEIETEKVNQQLYAPQSGIVNWKVKQGDVVKIGEVIAQIEPVASSAKEVAKKSEPKDVEKPKEIKKEEVVPKKVVEKEPAQKQVQLPLRKTKDDFLKELKTEEIKEPSKEVQEEPKTIKKEQSAGRETRKKMSNIRKVIAKRLVEAQQSAAMLTTFNEIDLSEVIHLREKYKEDFIAKHGVKLGFMSFFVKAAVAALEVYQDLNSYIDGDEIVHREYYDIGVAVGTDKGLMVPVIRNCNLLSFADIESAIEKSAKKAREGTLKVEDLQGGGFTITNGGVYGSLLSTPILNMPQSGILGMHKILKRPIAIDDQVVIRPMMYVALSYDHRIVDGKEAVSFLVHIKNLLEDPSRFVIDV